jgi:hypothetical protein
MGNHVHYTSNLTRLQEPTTKFSTYLISVPDMVDSPLDHDRHSPPGDLTMSTKGLTTMIDAHAQLTAAIAEAVKAAIAAGMQPGDITATLTRFIELIESQED